MVVSVRLLGVSQSGVRGIRRDAGEIRLTDRDLWALRWIGEQYAVRMDQLSRLLGSQPGGETSVEGVLSERRTRRIVERWTQARLVETRKILYAEPGWVWLSRAGLGAVGLQVKYLAPRPIRLSHVFWCGEVRRQLEAGDGDFEWRSERLLYAFGSALNPHHLPDAELVVGMDHQPEACASVLRRCLLGAPRHPLTLDVLPASRRARCRPICQAARLLI